MTEKRTTTLIKLLSAIETNIPHFEKRNSSVSQVTIGWHLNHTLKVINRVTAILIKTNPEKYKKKFNLMRATLFPLCYIPRGKAKAPKVVIPSKIITKEDIINQLQEAKIQIEKTKSLPKKSHFIHHIFGMLSKKQTLYFLEMHTKHHLKIVNDILNK
ncbi:DUF1569 domain-containing protein [uncultured Algibacter sp.]|uniref:DUF1569 domain-containing protein n=1 Tax=uncultured Algibacter sp. TaxID=298659 RepID=UPI00261565B0|nr:DUF1569 domain-containing protein [uncultured Algibacter sp.]